MVEKRCVESYLAAIVAHDWDVVRELVTPDVIRVGPYGETFDGREPYVSYLERLMPKLEGYAMDVNRVTYISGDGRAFAELTEHVTLNGKPTVTDEVLVFALDASGLIERIEIYIRSNGP